MSEEKKTGTKSVARKGGFKGARAYLCDLLLKNDKAKIPDRALQKMVCEKFPESKTFKNYFQHIQWTRRLLNSGQLAGYAKPRPPLVRYEEGKEVTRGVRSAAAVKRKKAKATSPNSRLQEKVDLSTIMNNPAVTYNKPGSMTILSLQDLYEHKRLNLEPGFQRQSVWSQRDRIKLIDSLLRKYPLPAIFLYKRPKDGELRYDVIDGKQRLETIFMFIGSMRGRFNVKMKTILPDQSEPETVKGTVDWPLLKRRGLQHHIEEYEIPVVVVDGELGDIIKLFIRINSTGKALTGQEKLHAKYYEKSPLLKEAARLAKRFEKYFRDMKVLTADQISRMKDIELICELMLSLHRGSVLNKKAALDKAMESDGFDGRQLPKASRLVRAALNRTQRMFPELRTTRLRKVTDFYSLAFLIGQYEQAGMILTDRHRNRQAWKLLCGFAANVDAVRDSQRKVEGIKPGQELYRDYLQTVSEMTDDESRRRRRHQILDGILGNIFAKKDSQRGFTPEQRRLIWHTSADQTCGGCGKKLTWDNFTLDHIEPYSKGGRSQLANAALYCRSCNSAKGNRRK